MKLSRSVTAILANIYTELIPSAIRSAFMDKLLLNIFLPKESAAGIVAFHGHPERWSDNSFVSDCYQRVGSPIARQTDLNNECIDYIIGTTSGKCVLDAGAGLGHLSHMLSLNDFNKVTALEVNISAQLRRLENHNIEICQGSIEGKLPFKDRQFDVVICTHVLEHVVDLKGAINELRRISRERLIIVVPLQVPSKYTPDLHMRYFMYPKNFIVETLPCPGKSFYKTLGGDLLYEENYA